MHTKYKIISICIFIASFFFITFGFGAYANDLTINDVSATIRQPLDIRITNLNIANTSEGVISNFIDFNNENIINDIVIPENGTVTYNVEFTNYANYPAYLIELTNLPTNLKYEIDIEKPNKYNLKEVFLENQNELREISITLSYKDNGYDKDNKEFNLNIGFYFESAYTIMFHDNILPSEYQQIEYIESTGTQYIDTEVLSNNNNLKFELQYSMTKLPTANSYVGIFGAYQNENSNSTRLIYGADNNGNSNALAYINSIAGGSALRDYTNRTINTIYTETIERNNNITKYTSNDLTNTKDLTNIQSGNAYSGNIAIFNQSIRGSIPSSMKLYYFRIYDEGVLLRYFIPCYRKTDGVVGLFDIVTNKFYTNKGTGTFKKGNNVSNYQIQNILTNKNTNLNKNTFNLLYNNFTGWNTIPTGTGTMYKDNQNIFNIAHNNETLNLYAQWRPFQAEIVFFANGGIGTMDKITKAYGGTQKLSTNNFKRGGFYFKEWNTQEDGSGKSYKNEEIVKIQAAENSTVLKLYAQWQKKLIPSEYIQLDYIESTGTQYIDTKVSSGNDNLKFELQYSMTKLPAANAYMGIFGAYNTENDNTTRLIYKGVNNSANSYAYINSKANTNALIDTTLRKENTIYTETIEKKNNVTKFTSNTTSTTIEIKNPIKGNTYSANIVIFDQGANSNIKSSMKLYYFLIYDNDDLIREFIPCYRSSDNQIGLYDIVTKEFYTNKGTGTFIKGPVT